MIILTLQFVIKGIRPFLLFFFCKLIHGEREITFVIVDTYLIFENIYVLLFTVTICQIVIIIM